ncbi:hypothetical protein PRZ48_007172 [Zasmidium cellare]|uniref:Fun14 family protein n=1 Tax=Zasmidium cellare TaxID=395010 RepID=A0ABR0EIL8_ZASCE|nr:hypothetical protein PRZ48_007172 [Zasmidium cellare]
MFTTRLFNCGLRTPLFAAGLGVSSAIVFTPLLQSYRQPIRLDSSPTNVSPKDWSFSQYATDARTPVVTSQGRFNTRAVRQLSAGSIIGLVAGLGVSLFSKPLALLIGLLIAGVQTAESYGIHLVPYKSIQGYVKGVDLRSAVQDNIAFKVSFGLMFALSAFAELPQ